MMDMDMEMSHGPWPMGHVEPGIYREGIRHRLPSPIGPLSINYWVTGK